MAMSHTMPAQGQWTVEEMWALLPDDGNRYEVIDGVLYVTPSPADRHQDALGALYARLRPFLERHPVAWVRFAPSDVIFSPGRGVQPDLYVAPLVAGRRPIRWQDRTRLLLAVEVLSPGTAARDRGVKRRLYQEHADEYWIVDLDSRIIERWRPGDERPQMLDAVLTWQPTGAGDPLTLDLPALFREVWDE